MLLPPVLASRCCDNGRRWTSRGFVGFHRFFRYPNATMMKRSERLRDMSRGRLAAIGMTLALAALVTMASIPVSAVVVKFPDPELEAAIREAIAKPTGDIHDSDLIGLRNLYGAYATTRDIVSLEGIQYCVNLTLLWASKNQIVDISPLSQLTKLTELLLSHNEIADISALAGLTNLRRLSLDWNRIVDIGPLSRLARLEELDLNNNQIVDIQALVDNPRLGEGDTVDLRNNYLDLTPGSLDMLDIEALRGRGVKFEEDVGPQRLPEAVQDPPSVEARPDEGLGSQNVPEAVQDTSSSGAFAALEARVRALEQGRASETPTRAPIAVSDSSDIDDKPSEVIGSLNDLDASVNRLLNRVAVLEQDASSMGSGPLQDIENRMQRLELQVAGAGSVSDLSHRLQALERQVNASHAYNTLPSNVASLGNTLNEAIGSLDGLNGRVNQLLNRVAALERSAGSMGSGSLRDIESRLQRLESQVAGTASISDLSYRVQALERQVQNAYATDTLASDVAGLRSAMQSLQNRISQLEYEVSRLWSQIRN